MKLRVLVGCEFSGIVREAFAARGCAALSCDLLPTEIEGPHYRGDVRDLLFSGYWDMLIAFPPCTRLASCGARWWRGKEIEQAESIEFVKMLLNAPIGRIAIENPIGRISTAICPPDQIIQPWQFGHPYQKATCLWLKNLPKLVPGNIVAGREQKCWLEPESKERWKKRSRTFPGIARAMADQWITELLCNESNKEQVQNE